MDFARLFNDYGIPNTSTVNRGWVNITCPFCDDSTYNGGFNIAGNYFHCWKCGGHNLIESLQIILQLPRKTVKQEIENYDDDTIIKHNSSIITHAKKVELPTESLTRIEERYLQKRGFDSSYLHSKYGLVSGGITGRWGYRVIIPIYYNNRIVSFLGRSVLSNTQQKENNIVRYKNLSNEESIINPKHLIYNLDNARTRQAILVEGTFDVMRIGDNCISGLGTDFTQEQIKTLANLYERIFIVFDNEEKAQQKAKKLGIELCALGVEAEIVQAYSYFNVNDGAELTDKQVYELKKELGI